MKNNIYIYIYMVYSLINNTFSTKYKFISGNTDLNIFSSFYEKGNFIYGKYKKPINNNIGFQITIDNNARRFIILHNKEYYASLINKYTDQDFKYTDQDVINFLKIPSNQDKIRICYNIKLKSVLNKPKLKSFKDKYFEFLGKLQLESEQLNTQIDKKIKKFIVNYNSINKSFPNKNNLIKPDFFNIVNDDLKNLIIDPELDLVIQDPAGAGFGHNIPAGGGASGAIYGKFELINKPLAGMEMIDTGLSIPGIYQNDPKKKGLNYQIPQLANVIHTRAISLSSDKNITFFIKYLIKAYYITIKIFLRYYKDKKKLYLTALSASIYGGNFKNTLLNHVHPSIHIMALLILFDNYKFGLGDKKINLILLENGDSKKNVNKFGNDFLNNSKFV